MQKEIHYVLIRPITKVISAGKLEQIYFYFLDSSSCEQIVGIQTFGRFQFLLSQWELNEDKK